MLLSLSLFLFRSSTSRSQQEAAAKKFFWWFIALGKPNTTCILSIFVNFQFANCKLLYLKTEVFCLRFFFLILIFNLIRFVQGLNDCFFQVCVAFSKKGSWIWCNIFFRGLTLYFLFNTGPGIISRSQSLSQKRSELW